MYYLSLAVNYWLAYYSEIIFVWSFYLLSFQNRTWRLRVAAFWIGGLKAARWLAERLIPIDTFSHVAALSEDTVKTRIDVQLPHSSPNRDKIYVFLKFK